MEGRFSSRRYTSGKPEAAKRGSGATKREVERQNRVGKGYRGAGIELFQIVLGLMCPGGLCRGGKSQNEAKSRRFGMDMPCRAFYEGVNPKTILNNCRQLCFNRHRRRHRGARQPKSALCHRWSSLLECFVTHQNNRKGQHRVEKCHRGIVIALCQNVW